ncbi:MAG TPA: cytochrome c [Pyrinomonadaceae bacterium]|nr:cytochrome c [Pyrinomonadaceae bacterium]
MRDREQCGNAGRGTGLPGVRPPATGGAQGPAGGDNPGGAARRKLKAALVAAAFGLAAAGFACSPTSGGGSGDTATARLYRRQCAACHGAEGAGGQVGSLTVADLRAPHAIAYADQQLYQKIHDGGNGMPPFKYSLSDQQIHDLVRFIRNDIQRRGAK